MTQVEKRVDVIERKLEENTRVTIATLLSTLGGVAIAAFDLLTRTGH